MEPHVLTVAAAGGLHCDRNCAGPIREALAEAGEQSDLILLAGDLTASGEEEDSRALASALADLPAPVVAVLGNHDWHAGRGEELCKQLSDAGAIVLDRGHAILELREAPVGIAGLKGFVGGFHGSHIPDFGEPLMRRLYAETTEDVKGLDRSLREIALCPIRIVLLHYSPTRETLTGERQEIWTMLGNDRLAAPLREHEPTAVFHGHAHAGQARGSIDSIPVHNVSLPVHGGEVPVLRLTAATDAAGAIR